MSIYQFRKWMQSKGRAWLVGRAIAMMEIGALVGTFVILFFPVLLVVLLTMLLLFLLAR